jgi:hypothetical protein
LGITEGLYTVSIDPVTDELLIKNRLTMNPELLDVSVTVTERVKELMEWRSTKLPGIYEPRLGVGILNNHCLMVEPFNMILEFDKLATEGQKESAGKSLQ